MSDEKRRDPSVLPIGGVDAERPTVVTPSGPMGAATPEPVTETSGPLPVASRLNLPVQLGRYKLLERLGAGGMAEVYLAEQSGIGGFTRTVVVKRILPHLQEDERFVKMFFREAQVAAEVTHSKVVQIYELGEAEETYFIAMEYVKGLTLFQLARRAWHMSRSVPMELVATAIADAAEALHYAWTADGRDGQPMRLIHRDISPDNLMINTEGTTKVVDFGIAKATGTRSVTKTGEMKGKIPYMAPEVLQNGEVDHRTDLFALGVTLYWLLTGKRPFEGETDLLLMQSIIGDRPKEPKELNPVVPDPLNDWVMALLEKDPNNRPADGASVAAALQGMVSMPRADMGTFVDEMRAAVVRISGESPITTGFLPATPITATMVAGVHKRPASSSPALAQAEAGPSDDDALPSEPTGEHGDLPEAATFLVSKSPRRMAAVGAIVALTAAVGVGLVAFGADPDDGVPPAPPVDSAAIPAVDGAAPAADDAALDAPEDVDEKPAARSAANPADDDDDNAREAGAAQKEDRRSSRRRNPRRRAGRTSSDDAPKADAKGTSAAADAPSSPPKRDRGKKASGGRAVSASGPAGIRWQTPGGKTLGRGSDKLTVPDGVDELVAFDWKLGVKTKVAIKGGKVDYRKLAKGELVVRAYPFAEVYSGTKKLGTTPFDNLKLVEGTYPLKFVYKGKSQTRTVEVKPGRTAVVKVRFD